MFHSGGSSAWLSILSFPCGGQQQDQRGGLPYISGPTDLLFYLSIDQGYLLKQHEMGKISRFPKNVRNYTL